MHANPFVLQKLRHRLCLHFPAFASTELHFLPAAPPTSQLLDVGHNKEFVENGTRARLHHSRSTIEQVLFRTPIGAFLIDDLAHFRGIREQMALHVSAHRTDCGPIQYSSRQGCSHR